MSVSHHSNLRRHMQTHADHIKINPGRKRYHPCDKCDKIFVFKHQLASHMRRHTGEKPYPCTKCSKRYSYHTDLTRHLLIHNKKQPTLCIQCNKSFSDHSRLKAHMMTHTRDPHTCTICDRSFTNCGNLQRHMKKHYGDEHSAITGLLDTADTSSTRSGSLLNKSDAHRTISENILPPSHPSTDICSNTADKDAKYNGADDTPCVEFVRKEHIDLCDFEGIKEEPPQKDTIKADNDDSSISQTNIKPQRRNQTGAKPCMCPLCNKCFLMAKNLSLHIKTHTGHINAHTGRKLHICDICFKSFADSKDHRKHMNTHLEEYYPCDKCDKRFGNNSHLASHMRSHTGEKPYSCTKCSKRYSYHTDLTRHLLIHNKKQPTLCIQCNKRFSDHSHLKVHMMTHTRDQQTCTICDMSFANGSNLRRHDKAYQINLTLEN